MKNLFIAVLVVLGVAGLLLVSEAQAGELTVYDNQGTKTSSASAVADIPLSGIGSGVVQTIKISAQVPSTLKVDLSATQIAWKMPNAGTYQTKAIDMTITSSEGGPKFVTVEGAAKLVNGATTLDTLYALKPTDEVGVPASGSYIAAASFNKKHELKNNKTSIWNKIVVPRGTSAGDFGDEFTVTFSQTL